MQNGQLIEEALTRSVIRIFYDVYNGLGYGFFESVYSNALERDLVARGHAVAREVGVIVRYKGDPIGVQRVDMIVDEKLIVEIKSTERIPQTSMRQLFSYLKATHIEVGLLLHFGPQPKFHRQIFSHSSQDHPRHTDRPNGIDPF